MPACMPAIQAGAAGKDRSYTVAPPTLRAWKFAATQSEILAAASEPVSPCVMLPPMK